MLIIGKVLNYVNFVSAQIEFNITIGEISSKDGSVADNSVRSTIQQEIQGAMFSSLVAYSEMTRPGNWTPGLENLGKAHKVVQYFMEMCSVTKIYSTGVGIDVVLTFVSIPHLDSFWQRLQSGDFWNRVHKYITTKHFLRKFRCTNIDVSVDMEEDAYHLARKYLGNFSFNLGICLSVLSILYITMDSFYRM